MPDGSEQHRQHGNIVPIRRTAFFAIPILQSGFALAQPQAASAPVDPAPVKVLCIGNSYTYYHRMPDTVAAMAREPAGSFRLRSWLFHQ